METITLTLCDNRLGSASSYLGGLTRERYLIQGRDVPAGVRLAVLTPYGKTLAAAEIETDDQGP